MTEEREISLEYPAYLKYATVYSERDIDTKACILYLHEEELLCGSKEDLPRKCTNTLTRAGYTIVSYDYLLAPAVRLDTIMDGICSFITHCINHPKVCRERRLPSFLWGHSAGAYLCPSAGVEGNLPAVPAGIPSHYGYGFLCSHWYKTSGGFYCSPPAVNASRLEQAGAGLHIAGSLDTHYSICVCVRQTGSWRPLLYEDRDKYFYLNYTLHVCTVLPCPLFCVHGTCDNDVPYSELLELSNRFRPWQFITSCDGYDFDRDEKNPFTEKLLDGTLVFLEESLELSPAQC